MSTATGPVTTTKPTVTAKPTTTTPWYQACCTNANSCANIEQTAETDAQEVEAAATTAKSDIEQFGANFNIDLTEFEQTYAKLSTTLGTFLSTIISVLQQIDTVFASNPQIKTPLDATIALLQTLDSKLLGVNQIVAAVTAVQSSATQAASAGSLPAAITAAQNMVGPLVTGLTTAQNIGLVPATVNVQQIGASINGVFTQATQVANIVNATAKQATTLTAT